MLIGYLVKPGPRTITKVEIQPGMVGAAIRALVECNLFDCVSIDGELDAWVDDEGLLKSPKHFTHIKGTGFVPLAGNVLFLGGPDEEGETTSCEKPLEWFVEHVRVATIGVQGWHAVTVAEEARA